MDGSKDFWIYASEIESMIRFHPSKELAEKAIHHPRAFAYPEFIEACVLRLSGEPLPPFRFMSLAECRGILKRWPDVHLEWLKFSGLEREIVVPD